MSYLDEDEVHVHDVFVIKVTQHSLSTIADEQTRNKKNFRAVFFQAGP